MSKQSDPRSLPETAQVRWEGEAHIGEGAPNALLLAYASGAVGLRCRAGIGRMAGGESMVLISIGDEIFGLTREQASRLSERIIEAVGHDALLRLRKALVDGAEMLSADRVLH